MEFITIEVNRREALGSANSSRLRRAGSVPAVLYGLKRPNISLAIASSEMQRFLKTGSHLVELKLGDKARPAILREIQWNEVTDEMLHVDFNRVDADEEVETTVPVNFKGRAKGESEGGMFLALLPDVTISARPKDLPRQYLVDITSMSVGDAIRISDLEERAGVSFKDGPDTVVAHVVEPKGSAADEEDGEEGGEAPEAEAPNQG